MTTDNRIETLIEGHSFEEIESIRDNLAQEIEKRTNQLKSIVKEKYNDIVDVSDAIQTMKLDMKKLQDSLWSLDTSISEFYEKIKGPHLDDKQDNCRDAHEESKSVACCDQTKCDSYIVMELLDYYADLWDNFDAGNLKQSVTVLKQAKKSLADLNVHQKSEEIVQIKKSIDRSEEMIKNHIWHKIQVAAPDQIGIIAGSDQEDLYELSLSSSIQFLVEELKESLSDTSYQAQIKRYQPCFYFNSQTNEIEPDLDELKIGQTSLVGYVQIPKSVSLELSQFLYRVCAVINTIAGFNLNKSSIVESLRIVIERVLDVYRELQASIDMLKARTKRKRALQLYYDLLYLRILLNNSKNTDLIEKLDPKITQLACSYEMMLDSIELFMISSALHLNVMQSSQSTIRLYGLLIPHLQ